MELTHRPRRLRRSESVRSLVRETSLRADDFIFPMFVTGGEGQRQPIESMPGQFRFSVDELVKECRSVYELGIPAVNFFGYSEDKDDMATSSYDPKGLIQRAVHAVKTAVPELCVQTDIALDPYTNHGHDGLVVDGEIVNDETIAVLCKMAVSHAEAGVDWVAPSDMMDTSASWPTRPSTPRVFTGHLGERSTRRRKKATKRPIRWTRPTRARHCAKYR
jgi:porphobilinogen synthase